MKRKSKPGYHWTVEQEQREIRLGVENVSFVLTVNKRTKNNEEPQPEPQQKNLQDTNCKK